MKIDTAVISGFRGISRPVVVPMSQLTVLTGPNNVGKSTLLHAFHSILGERRNPDPNAMNRTPPPGRPRGYSNLPESFELNLTLDEDDLKKTPLPAGFPSNEKCLKLVYGNSNEYPIKTGTSTVIAVVQGTVYPDDGIRQLFRWVERNIRFVYIPANRSVEGFKSGLLAEMAASSARQRLGTNSDILEGYLQDIEVAVEEASSTILSELKPFLPRLESVRFELERPQLEDILRIKEVFVDDGSNSIMELKGDGFKSMFVLAMLQYFAKQRHRRTLIFGIEEPEAHLNSDAIYAAREAIRNLSKTYQTIVNTHSPIFVRRDDLGATLLVERVEEENNRIQVQQAQNIREIKNSLGIRKQENMLSASVVLLVEGATDRHIVRHLLTLDDTEMARMLDEGVVQIVATKGTKYMRAHVEYLERDLTPTIVLLDGDKAGSNVIEELKAHTSLPQSDYKQVPVISGYHEREIEDCFAAELWVNEVSKKCRIADLTPDTFETARIRSRKAGLIQKWSSVMEYIIQKSFGIWDAPSAKEALADAVITHLVDLDSSEFSWVRHLRAQIKEYTAKN